MPQHWQVRLPASRTRPFAGKRILVIGSGHSAMDVIHDLAVLKAKASRGEILWAMRSAPTTKTLGGADTDQLASRGAGKPRQCVG